ncbi:IS630 family transposase [Paraburkholderia sp. RL17-380-BIE-A]|uniref:IS630 family transposase n=1 Tax=Paraburkholderia sp. RL17-380-BIE-A TaxID=3031630 RepID=UPI0038BC7EFD
MYSDIKEWTRIRARVLNKGESIRYVANAEGISRNTVRKMVRFELPPGYCRVTDNTRDATRRRKLAVPWSAVQRIVRALPERGAAQFLARLFSEDDTEELEEAAGRRLRTWGVVESPKIGSAERSRQRWQNWMYQVEQGLVSVPAGEDCRQQDRLMRMLLPVSRMQRHKSLTMLAHEAGFSLREIATHLAISRASVRTYIGDYKAGGLESLFAKANRPRREDDEALKSAVFTLLHEPPSASGINRTTWKMVDLRRVLAVRGHHAGTDAIRSIMRHAGYRWKSAKIVLTSTDPNYLEKLDHIRSVLANLQPDERFFSIDEFGPFSVTMKPGRVLAAPDVQPNVPQWQKSKGCLICTAALELSSNRVTHFYSTAKNTDEMIRMATGLLDEYGLMRKLYLSWDAASWHLSRRLSAFISDHNEAAQSRHQPILELAPLPASAQFLNVIESVFSGMARAIIHNSDYASADAAKAAIDCYFAERNQHFTEHPKRAGKAIWRKERTTSEFSAANNCKDPGYR